MSFKVNVEWLRLKKKGTIDWTGLSYALKNIKRWMPLYNFLVITKEATKLLNLGLWYQTLLRNTEH